MKKLLRISAAAVTAVSLTAGMAGASVSAASSARINDTGRNSDNNVMVQENHRRTVRNNNRVHVENFNDQLATTGHARSTDNRDGGGGASTGHARNTKNTDTDVRVHNTASSNAAMQNGGNGGFTGTISDTGRNSDNNIDFRSNHTTRVNNNNDVTVVNDNVQSAHSGNATSSDNRDGGGEAMSGDAHNTSTTSTSVDVSQ